MSISIPPCSWIIAMNFIPLLPLIQPFLKWRYPVRIHQHTKAVTPPPDLWKFIKEGFYDDYTDTHNSKPPHSTMLSNMHITVLWLLLAGDAKNEVPITNLAKIEFPGREPKKAACKLIFTRSLWKLCILYFQWQHWLHDSLMGSQGRRLLSTTDINTKKVPKIWQNHR